MGIVINVHNIFPVPIYTSLIENIKVKKKFIDSIEFGEQIGNNVGLSYDDRILEDNQFLNLRKEIDGHVSYFFHEILGYSDAATTTHCSSWFVKSNPGQRTIDHSHSNSLISGVFYLKTPQNSGDIVFISEMPQVLSNVILPDIKSKNFYNDRSYRITPQEGMILLFPSYLKHQVDYNKSNDTRLSLAFNYFIKGELSSRTGKLTL